MTLRECKYLSWNITRTLQCRFEMNYRYNSSYQFVLYISSWKKVCNCTSFLSGVLSIAGKLNLAPNNLTSGIYGMALWCNMSLSSFNPRSSLTDHQDFAIKNSHEDNKWNKLGFLLKFPGSRSHYKTKIKRSNKENSKISIKISIYKREKKSKVKFR